MKMIKGLLRDRMILLIAAFLFFQSAFEGLINNWTTTYLIDQLSVTQSSALIALSSYVAGMTVMRLVIGSVFRNVSEQKLLFSSFLIIFVALVILSSSSSIIMAAAAFALLGTGLAAGFPTMLGIVGNRYPDISGTAFSFVMAVALIGNIIVNYSMGQVAENYGISHLTTFTFAEVAVLVILALLIFRKSKYNHYKS